MLKAAMKNLAAASSRAGLDSLALTNLDGGLVVNSSGPHPLFDLSGHGQESLFDVGGVLCGSLKKGDANAVCEFLKGFSIVMSEYERLYLRHRVLDGTLIGHIALVTNKQLVDSFCSVSVDFLQPLLNVVEGIHVGNIVDDTNTMGTAIVRRSDGAESLLASGIPLSHVSLLPMPDSQRDVQSGV